MECPSELVCCFPVRFWQEDGYLPSDGITLYPTTPENLDILAMSKYTDLVGHTILLFWHRKQQMALGPVTVSRNEEEASSAKFAAM